MKRQQWQKGHRRVITQILSTLVMNANIRGFFTGLLYDGPLKQVCVPGMNCHSCPGALGACPIGALQAIASGRKHSFSLYAAGALLLFGLALGRLVCGWLCPFGLVQDLLHRVHTPKLTAIPGDHYARLLKYAVLLVLVLLLPAALERAGVGTPWFCQWLCPSGTLMAALPLAAVDAGIRGALGGLFTWKLLLLLAILAFSLLWFRPFCKYLCPLGAIYGLCNKLAMYKMSVNEQACVKCGACAKACPMQVPMPAQPNHYECIRCGKCKNACSQQAITAGFARGSGKLKMEND